MWAPLGPRLPFVWQAQYTEPPGGCGAWAPLAWAPLGPRLPFVGQAQYTEPPGGAAAHGHRWRSCGARGRRWGRGCLLCGRRSTQSLLEELRRVWAPLVPRLPFVWQAQYTELLGGALTPH